MPVQIPCSPSIIVAGCGEMGWPMAERLLASQYDVKGFDIRPADQFTAARFNMCSASELSDCEILISVVRSAEETDALCFEEQGVFSRARYPSVLVVCSTLKPAYIKTLQEALPPDVMLIDAPMSGASVAAAQGQLTFMLGGDTETLDQLHPVFQAMGRQFFRAGHVGAGMTLKVLNNYVAATSVVSVRRVLDAANRVGVSQELLRDVMSSSSGETWFGNRFDDIEWAREGYAFDNTIGILEKDVLCALDVIVDAGDICGSERSSDHCSEDLFDVALLDALRRMQKTEILKKR